MKKDYEVPKEEKLKVIDAIGTCGCVDRLQIYREVGGRLKPSFNFVMDHLIKIGAIIEVSKDAYALHPVFSEMSAEEGLEACFPMIKQKQGKGFVWIASH